MIVRTNTLPLSVRKDNSVFVVFLWLLQKHLDTTGWSTLYGKNSTIKEQCTFQLDSPVYKQYEILNDLCYEDICENWPDSTNQYFASINKNICSCITENYHMFPFHPFSMKILVIFAMSSFYTSKLKFTQTFLFWF